MSIKRTLQRSAPLRAAGWLLAGLLVAGGAIANPGAMASGEVRKIDLDGAKLTLKHGEIKSLDMPPMTMVFHMADKKQLEKLQVGDKVRFKASQVQGRYTVTEIEKQP